MPPSSFNTMDSNNTEWDALMNARAMYESTRTDSGATGAGNSGQMLLVAGGAILAIICIAMALIVG